MKAETTKVLLPRTVLETGIDKDIEFEGSLADYLPGINRIIRTEANLLPEEIELNGSKAELKGKAVFSLLYESDYKGKLKNEKFTVNFNQKFDVGELPKGENFASVSCRCSHVSCKTLNPRKFILRCRGDIRLCVSADAEAEVVATSSDSGAFYKTDTVSLSGKLPPLRKDFNVEESFNFEGATPISEIIYSHIKLIPESIEFSDGNAVIKFNGSYKCLYEEEGEEYKTTLATRKLSTSVTIEDDSISANSAGWAELIYDGCEAIKEQDNYGENRIVSVSAGIGVILHCYNSNETELPVDMYFEDYDCETREGQFRYENVKTLPKHKFALEKAFEIPELPFDSCIDKESEISVSEITKEGEYFQIKGNCSVNVLGEKDGSFFTQDLSFPYSVELSNESASNEMKLKAQPNILSTDVHINNGRMNVKVNAELYLESREKSTVQCLSGAEITKKDEGSDRKAIIVYYPDKGESAWEIGKRFNISPDNVLEANGTVFDKTNSVADSGTVLFI